LMTELIELHRSFEIISNTIQTIRQMDSRTVNEVGKLA